jgi:hypothetical protein
MDNENVIKHQNILLIDDDSKKNINSKKINIMVINVESGQAYGGRFDDIPTFKKWLNAICRIHDIGQILLNKMGYGLGIYEAIVDIIPEDIDLVAYKVRSMQL